MSDKCPGCKAEATVQHRTSDWFECGSHLQHDLPGDVPDRFIESEHCLRNQLAQANAENKRLRAENEQLREAASRGCNALDCIKAGETISSEDAHFYWNVRDDMHDMLRGACWLVKYTPEARQRILAQQEAAQAESDENNL